MSPTAPLAVLLAAAVAGCAPSAPPPRPAAEAPLPAASSGASAAPAPPAEASAAPAAPPASRPLRPAHESTPEGAAPLTEAERQELSGPCQRFAQAMAREVGKKKADPDVSRSEQVLAALDAPPAVPGVDVPRCAGLMRRDVVAFAALQAEREVHNDMKIVAVNLAVAFEATKGLCPSAGPSPASLAALEGGAVPSVASDWAAPGWQCVRFGPTTPRRWQLQLSTDPKARTWRIVARGYPVKGAPPAELVLEGTVDEDGVSPPGMLLRR